MQNPNEKNRITVITGPTAVGKTRLAAALAAQNDAEIISADSRQVYQQMDIGTGKDLEEYQINGKTIPYHLIDICNPGEKYNVYRFKQDFTRAAKEIQSRQKEVIVCGGTGMYIDAVVRNYHLQKVPENAALKHQLEKQSKETLVAHLAEIKPLHNTTDTTDKERLIRAIEIAEFEKTHPVAAKNPFRFRVFAIKAPREVIKQNIRRRLKQRLENGMIDEVETLLKQGIPKETLYYYGLEYRYVSMYLNGELNYNDMYQKLNSAIALFAKKQMTFIRRIEKMGTTIHWIDFSLNLKDKVKLISQ